MNRKFEITTEEKIIMKNNGVKKKIYLMKETALYMMMQWSVRMQGFVMMLL